MRLFGFRLLHRAYITPPIISLNKSYAYLNRAVSLVLRLLLVSANFVFEVGFRVTLALTLH